MIKENHIASDYIKEKTYKSRINGRKLTEEYIIECPKCGVQNPLIEHGVKFHCRCGLEYQLWGNILELTDAL
jgi:ribosomal protein S27AE